VEEQVRRANPQDLGRVAVLATDAIAELEPTKGGAVWARREARPLPVEGSLAADLASEDHEMVVGTLDDVVLGYGVARVERLRDGSLLGVVEDLYVDPGARDLSLGEVMMDHLLAWCAERGCFGVDSLALPGNRATKNFFERFGLVARAIVVHKPLR
jgi:ribosomal protein S18 acetylase RimI-like enzyme